MGINVYSQSAEDITAVCNQSIDAVLIHAKKNGVIDENQFQKLIRMRVIVTDRKDLFSTFFDYLKGRNDKLNIRVVTLEDRPVEGTNG